MRLIELDKSAETTSTSGVAAAESSFVAQKSYHELSDRPVVEADVLEQLHANMNLLTDLQGRLSHLMREVRYVLKA